jgi:hypothetical protein
MENKKGTPKGVLFYENWLDLLCDHLTAEQSIEIIKLIRAEYKEEIYETSDSLVKSNWFLIKPQLQSNLEKYRNKCKKNAENGFKGGRPRTQSNPSISQNNHSVFSETQNKQSESKSETESKSESETFTCVKDHLGISSPSLGEGSSSLPSVEESERQLKELFEN